MSRGYMLSKRNKPKPNLAVSGERAFEILRRPIITEKASLASVNGQYVFQVAIDATKAEIKAAVEQMFSVDVTAVNTSIAKGKTKRFRGHLGQRSNIKKAYVSLAAGQQIDTGIGA
jgi:large subunit ribosomal protein L23